MRFIYIWLPLSLAACGGGDEAIEQAAVNNAIDNSIFATNNGATSPGGIFTEAEFGGVGSGYPGGVTWRSFENHKLTTAYRIAEREILAVTPSLGTASMTGYLTVNISAEQQLMGNLSIEADFTGGTLTGTAGDFTLLAFTPQTVAPAETLSGTLSLGNSSFSGSWVTSELSGQLSGTQTYDINSTPQARLYYELGSGEYTLWGSEEPGTISYDGGAPQDTLVNYIVRN